MASEIITRQEIRAYLKDYLHKTITFYLVEQVFWNAFAGILMGFIYGLGFGGLSYILSNILMIFGINFFSINVLGLPLLLWGFVLSLLLSMFIGIIHFGIVETVRDFNSIKREAREIKRQKEAEPRKQTQQQVIQKPSSVSGQAPIAIGALAITNFTSKEIRKELRQNLKMPIVVYLLGQFIIGAFAASFETFGIIFLGYGFVVGVVSFFKLNFLYLLFDLPFLTLVGIFILLVGICGGIIEAKQEYRFAKGHAFGELEHREWQKEEQARFEELKIKIRNHIKKGGKVECEPENTYLSNYAIFSGGRLERMVLESIPRGFTDDLNKHIKIEQQKYDAEQERIAKEKEEAEKKARADARLQASFQNVVSRKAAIVQARRLITTYIQSGMGAEEALDAALNAPFSGKVYKDYRLILDFIIPLSNPSIRDALNYSDSGVGLCLRIGFASDIEQLQQYAQEKKQKYDEEQKAIRKQKEAEERRKQEVWEELVRLIKRYAISVLPDFDPDERAEYVLKFDLPKVKDITLRKEEYESWRKQLKKIAEEARKDYLETVRAENKKKYDAALRAYQREKQQTAKYVRHPNRTEAAFLATVQGHSEFVASVRRVVLDELKIYAWHRYKEVLEYLDKAVFDPKLYNKETGEDLSGRADGLFSLDGSGNDKNLQISQLNTHERFRHVFLHELAHNVRGHRISRGLSKTQKEDEANKYAAQVEQEMLWNGLPGQLSKDASDFLKGLPGCPCEVLAA